MARLSIGGAELRFSMDEFDRLARDAGAVFGNRVFTSELQPLRDVVAGTAVRPHEVIRSIARISPEKRQKYRKVIDYIAFHYPDLIPGGDIEAVLDPAADFGTTFAQEYAQMLPGDFMDLLYGAAVARAGAPYVGQGARICDDLNNTAKIGNGVAFDRQWSGRGALGTTTARAETVIEDSIANPGVLAPHRPPILQGTRQAHVTSLMASRLNPVTALEMDTARLRKDRQVSADRVQRMNEIENPRDRRIERHLWAHARMVKSVRRACKGGIAMVASLSGYTAVNAKVHFVLDRLGDLGRVAMKQPLADDSEFLAITTSELVFCHRYWKSTEFPLSNVVKFYVNGRRVTAPWDGDWRMNDYRGEPVVSNQEAWRRYELARGMRSVPKSFPRF